MLFIAVVCLIVGLINTFFPEMSWKMRRGWRLKDTGPTIAALILSRVVGAAMIVVSVVLIVRMIIRG